MRSQIVAAIASSNTASTNCDPAPKTGRGTKMPRLLMKTSPSSERLWRGPGKVAEHREVPEQDLEQERQVADQFHIAAGEPRQQPIGREPRDPDKKPQHRGKHDADDGDQQRVEQTDEEDPPVGVLLTVWNERLADAEPGGVVEKAKAAGDLLGVEIGLGIEREFVAEPQHRRQQHELIE